MQINKQFLFKFSTWPTDDHILFGPYLFVCHFELEPFFFFLLIDVIFLMDVVLLMGDLIFQHFGYIRLGAFEFSSCLALRDSIFIVEHDFKKPNILCGHYYCNPTTCSGSFTVRLFLSMFNYPIKSTLWIFSYLK